MTEAPETRPSLIVRLRNPQDESAWSLFLAIYQPLVIRMARRWGLQEADAEEVAQQVLINVAGAIERWNPDRRLGTFRGWLFRIARNLTINMLLQAKRHPRGGGGSDVLNWIESQPAPAETVEFLFEYRRQLFHWAAEQIRQEFQPQTWQAFWQTCVEGIPIPVVAQQLGTTVGSVYVSRSRVLARLREVVQTNESEVSR